MAKNIESNINIGWHKFAYACVRFMAFKNLDIYPVYFLRTIGKVLLFIFPKFSFYKDGIILNDIRQMIPQKIFSVSIK
jgi:hypothetical protein